LKFHFWFFHKKLFSFFFGFLPFDVRLPFPFLTNSIEKYDTFGHSSIYLKLVIKFEIKICLFFNHSDNLPLSSFLFRVFSFSLFGSFFTIQPQHNPFTLTSNFIKNLSAFLSCFGSSILSVCLDMSSVIFRIHSTKRLILFFVSFSHILL
jgi:hypothetical protein